MVLYGQDLTNFRNAYNKAVRLHKNSFIWKGNEVLTAFAKYIIEYSSSKTK